MRLAPHRDKTFDDLENEMQAKIDTQVPLIPMTMEGCVVRMTDTIAYIGRDIEDAIRLGIIDRSDLPAQSVERLGRTNGTIVFNLVSDIIANSSDKPYITFSPEVSDALHLLKRFNLERIYMNPAIKKHLGTIEELFGILFEQYLADLEKENRSSAVFSQFLKDMSSEYINRHSYQEIVRDFISGMTDQYFLRQCPEALRPKPLVR